MATAIASSPPPASLLTIPCELRNAVYYYVFCCNDSDNELSSFAKLKQSESRDIIRALNLPSSPTASVSSRSSSSSYQNSCSLNLLLANRQIHAEAHTLALHHTTFHLAGETADPENFALFAHPLINGASNKLSAIRHLTLTARISHLRALNERWNGLPFGHSGLYLETLTLIPRKPECHTSAYAEVADLSQSHTLAYIVAETAKTLRNVRCLVVKNEGCFSEVVWRLVYRSLVYRIWRWSGPRAGLRFECSGDMVEEGREWLRMWIGEEVEGEEAREVGEEVVRLVGGKGEATGIQDIPGL